MPTYSVRSIFRLSSSAGQKLKHLYEERITLWNASSLDEALELAERESDEYAKSDRGPVGPLQGFWLFEDWTLPTQGIEVFSLLRESDLDPEEYVRAFFDTGHERQGHHSGDTGAPDQRP